MIKLLNYLPLRILKKMKFLPQDLYVTYLYEYYTGKKLDLKSPKEFNEKIQWCKVYYRPKILNQLADKYAVRKYVEEKIGSQYLNKNIGVYDKVSEIDFDVLPNQFVIKAVHASSFNIIVKDKSKLNRIKSKALLIKWMNRNQYYRTGLEWAYKDIKPRLVVDKYLEEPNNRPLINYKFFCFNGKPKFLLVVEGGVTDYKCFYDMNWKKEPYYDSKWDKLPFLTDENHPVYDEEVEKPSNFEEMKLVAEKLADKFPFVRVDLYSVKGETVFGEMTFYPADGRKDVTPDKYNRIMGDYMVLPKIPKGQTKITEY